MPYFLPPVVYDNPPTLPGGGVVNSYAKWKKGQRRGRSVLKIAGVYTTVDVPTVDQTNAAEEYYAGGHIYNITDEVAAALYAAGYLINSQIIMGYPGYLLAETQGFLTTEAGEPLVTEYVYAG